MKRDLRYLGQAELRPRDRVAVFIDDLQIPVIGGFIPAELYLDALAVGEGILAHDVFAPLILVMRADENLVKLDAGLVDQREVLVAGAGNLRGQSQGKQHGDARDKLPTHILFLPELPGDPFAAAFIYK